MIPNKMMAFPAIFKQEQKNGTVLIKPEAFSFQSSQSDDEPLDIEWNLIEKHQVSPASHPKSMLKIVLKPDVLPIEQRENNGGSNGNGKKANPFLTFQLASRSELERARKEISQQLALTRQKNDESGGRTIGSSTTSKGVKRNIQGTPIIANDSATPEAEELVSSKKDEGNGDVSSATARAVAVEDFTKVPEELLEETRAALLAGDTTLRQQHRFLVKESGTLTEEDFWHSHQDQLAEQCARMFGKFQKGTKTYMASNLQLQGKIRLGVEEMRQIFILYPAVHKAYVAKVPLELSEEQFWKKYLESEYFYRDRGKIGQMSQNLRKLDPPPKKPTKADSTDDHMADTDKNKDGKDSSSKDDDKKKNAGPTQPGGGAVVAGADDIFTRYDLELREQQAESINGNGSSSATTGAGAASNSHSKLGRNLAVGQFDLASSFNAERPHIGENDLHPDVAKGRGGSVISQGYTGTAEAARGPASIISKVNRHWAMVLHPMEAKAGTMDWVNVARHSVEHAVPSDPTARVGGGFDEEFSKMVEYADCDEALADHIRNAGNVDDFETLELQNIAAYSGKGNIAIAADALSDAQRSSLALRELQKQVVYSRTVEDNCKRLIQGCFKLKPDNDILAASSGGVSLLSKTSSPKTLPPSTIPPADIGIRLMQALSKRMGDSNKTDNDAQKIASELPSDFKSKIDGLFRRSSELLRHFFGLRRVISAEQEKVASKNPPGAGGFAPVKVSGFAPVVGAGGIGGGGGTNGNSSSATQQKESEESKKLERIFDGMKSLYEEMEAMRQNLPQTVQGEQMRRMCKPIMDQLDLAFQLHHRGTASGVTGSSTRTAVPVAGATRGGFAPVRTVGGHGNTGGGGFAPVANSGGFAPVNLPPASS